MRNVLAALLLLVIPGFYSLASAADYTDSATGMKFVFVKGGCFQMWASSKEAAHEVCVDDLYIGKYEVTQGQWKALMVKNPSIYRNCGEDCPVEAVSWDEANEFINRMNKKTGKKYRLPFESEWEYAARSGGKDEKWAGTNDVNELGDFAWYAENSGERPHPAGLKKPNGLGIFDMTGNVWEWMGDTRFEIYSSPAGTGEPGKWEYFVLRGGSWDESPEDLRSVTYQVRLLIETEVSVGFRVALTAR